MSTTSLELSEDNPALLCIASNYVMGTKRGEKSKTLIFAIRAPQLNLDTVDSALLGHIRDNPFWLNKAAGPISKHPPQPLSRGADSCFSSKKGCVQTVFIAETHESAHRCTYTRFCSKQTQTVVLRSRFL